MARLMRFLRPRFPYTLLLAMLLVVPAALALLDQFGGWGAIAGMALALFTGAGAAALDWAWDQV